MHPQPTEPATGTCRQVDPTTVTSDDEDVAAPALTHMADATCHAAMILDRNGSYPADHAVQALARTTIALADIADQVDPYVGDVWPGAHPDVARAANHLAEAAKALNVARDHTLIHPPTDSQAEPAGDLAGDHTATSD